MNGRTGSLRIGMTSAFALAALTAVAVLIGMSARDADAAPKKQSKPNVVVILTDDQRVDDMKWMPKTRRLLGAQGTTFSKFMAPFPLCCPARMSIMTGQYPHNHGLDGNFPPEGYLGLTRAEQMKTLPVWLRKAGYQTSHVGKYLNGYGSLNQTEVPVGWTDWHGSIDQTSYDMFNYWLNDNGKVSKYGDEDWNEAVMNFSRDVSNQVYPDWAGFQAGLLQTFIASGVTADGNFGTTSRKDHQVDQLARRAVGFIGEASRKKAPFFLHFAPPAPHREDVPEQVGYRGINPRVPARYEKKIEGLQFSNLPSFDEADISDKPPLLSNFKPLGDMLANRPITGLQQIENYRRGRVGNLWALDDAVSGIVSELKKKGELENTLIIFHSDNGWLLGEHRIAGDKYVPYEESLLVPTLIRGPGWPKGKKVSALGSNVDLTKTILDATGAKANRTQDGIPLLPLARGKAKPRTAALMEATRSLFVKPGFPYAWDVPYFGVRTNRYKYVNWCSARGVCEDGQWVTGGEELYDLKTDPYEMENLASDPALVAKKAELLALAQSLRGCKGKACVVR